MDKIEYITTKMVRESSAAYISDKKILSPDDSVKIINGLLDLENADKEFFIVAYLNTRNQINALTVVSIGSLSETIVHPREVFKGAILYNAAAIILFHNHPSGDSTFSAMDKKTTDRLVKAGKILGITILDHISIGYNNIHSMKEDGHI